MTSTKWAPFRSGSRARGPPCDAGGQAGRWPTRARSPVGRCSVPNAAAIDASTPWVWSSAGTSLDVPSAVVEPALDDLPHRVERSDTLTRKLTEATANQGRLDDG